MSEGLSLRRMRWRCHCRVDESIEVVESDVEGEDSEANREERKRGEIGDFIVVVAVAATSAEDILCGGASSLCNYAG